MKKTIAIYIFLLSNVLVFGQTNATIDSLHQLLKQKNIEDTTKVNSYMYLASYHFKNDLDSMNLYNQLALKLSKKINDFKLAKIYSNIGSYQYNNFKIDSAHYYFDKALLELDKNEDLVLRSTIYGNYSLTFENTNNTFKELEYSLKAIELMIGNDEELSFLYFNHSIIYDDGGFREESKKYLKLANVSSKKANEFRVEAASVRQLAYYAMEEKKYDSAKVYLDRGTELSKILDTPETYFEINAMLGKYYSETGAFSKADIALLEAKKNALKRKRDFDLMICNVLLGEHELRKGNYSASSNYFKEFEKQYALNEVPQLGAMAYESWAKSEAKLNNYKASNVLMKKYITIQDSLFTSKNRNLLANADAKFQSEKKDKEILQQKLLLEQNANELQIKNTQTYYVMGIAVFLLLTSILIWIVFQQRQKRKNQEIISLKREHQINTLESLMEGEEKERFRIAKELHDGVNGDLSAIKFKLSSLLEMNNNEVNEAIKMIDSSCQQVRAISHNLIPPSLEKFSLLEATQDYCSGLDAVQTVHIMFQHLGENITIPKKAEVNIFRIIQELVTNSIKHAQAKEINVQISCREKNIQVTVEDDGIGYLTDEDNSNGIGLKNINSRVDYLQATIDVVSNKQGTSTAIEIDTTKLNDN